jgi:hypothetical protein
MYFDTCPNCDAPYGPCSPRQTATYQSVEIWPSRFDLDHITCMNCGIVEAGYQPDYDVHRQARWMDKLEVLKPNVDYDYVRSTRRPRLNRRMDVVWMWNPTGAAIRNDAGADVMENEIIRLHLGRGRKSRVGVDLSAFDGHVVRDPPARLVRRRVAASLPRDDRRGGAVPHLASGAEHHANALHPADRSRVSLLAGGDVAALKSPSAADERRAAGEVG